LEKKKTLIIVLFIALALVLGTVTYPTISKRFKKKSDLKQQPELQQTTKSRSGSTSENSGESKQISSVESKQTNSEPNQTNSESRKTREEGATSPAAEEAELEGVKKDEAETNWMKSFLTANRTWGRSPFLRIGEGMGKILIMSSPSSADIYIDGVKMPNQTNWLTPLTLPPKKYILEIKKDGYYPYRQELVVTAGIEEFPDINTINATLEKKPVNVEEVAAEIWRQLKRPALYVSMIVFDEEKPSALITEYNPDSPPPEGNPLSNRVVFEGDTFTLPGSSEESKRSFVVKNIFSDHVVIEDTLVNWDYKLEIYKEAK
jgi:hypothetical protein